MLARRTHRRYAQPVIRVSVFLLILLGTLLFTEKISQTHASAPSISSSDAMKQYAKQIKTPTLIAMDNTPYKPSSSPSTPASNTTKTTATAQSSGTTQINEQFVGSSLNTDLWQIMSLPKGYRNNEEQDYVASQVQVADGSLQITAAKDSAGNWHSGEVHSKWDYTYGDFSVRMAISSTGPGIWPAAWLMGTTGQWPTNGEIDIMEHVNSEPSVYGTIHGGGSNGMWQLQGTINPINVLQYHTYMIRKQPGVISWWVDGVKQNQWTQSQMPASGVWPFENYSNFGLLNLAIGGNWPGPTNDSTPSSVTMYVDSFIVSNAS